MQLEQLVPFTDTTLNQFTHGIVVSFIYPVGESLPILMILPYASQQAHRTRDLVISAGFANMLMAILVTISMLVMGLFLTQHTIFGSFVLSQRSISPIFQRIEVLMASSWLISTYFKATVYLYAFVLGVAELFRLKSYQFLILPSVMIVYALSNLVTPNMVFFNTTVIPIGWRDFTVSLVLPVLLLIIYKIKSKLASIKG